MAETSKQYSGRRKNYEQIVHSLTRAAVKIVGAYNDLARSGIAVEDRISLANSVNETFQEMRNLYGKERSSLSPEDLKAVEGLEFDVELIPLEPLVSEKTSRTSTAAYLQNQEDMIKKIREVSKFRQRPLIQ